MKITDEHIAKAFEGHNFGPEYGTIQKQKKLVAQTIFKRMAGYSIGSGMQSILVDLFAVGICTGEPLVWAKQWVYRYYNDMDE